MHRIFFIVVVVLTVCVVVQGSDYFEFGRNMGSECFQITTADNLTPTGLDRAIVAADLFQNYQGEEILFATATSIELYSSRIDFNTRIGHYPVPLPTGWFLGTPCVGDINNDSYLDIAVTIYTTCLGGNAKIGQTHVLVMLGGFNGPSGAWISTTSPADVSSQYVIAKDVDGDGSDELFLSGIRAYWPTISTSNPIYVPLPPTTRKVWRLSYGIRRLDFEDGALQQDAPWQTANFEPTITPWPGNNNEFGGGFSVPAGEVNAPEYHVLERVAPVIFFDTEDYYIASVAATPQLKGTSAFRFWGYHDDGVTLEEPDYTNPRVVVWAVGVSSPTVQRVCTVNEQGNGLSFPDLQTAMNFEEYAPYCRASFFELQEEYSLIAGAIGDGSYSNPTNPMPRTSIVVSGWKSANAWSNPNSATNLYISGWHLNQFATNPESNTLLQNPYPNLIPNNSPSLYRASNGNSRVMTDWSYQFGQNTSKHKVWNFDNNGDAFRLTSDFELKSSCVSFLYPKYRIDLQTHTPLYITSLLGRPVSVSRTFNNIAETHSINSVGTATMFANTRHYDLSDFGSNALSPAPALLNAYSPGIGGSAGSYRMKVAVASLTQPTITVTDLFANEEVYTVPFVDGYPFKREWVITSQAYQNFRHTGCPQEGWRNTIIQTPRTWENRVIVQNVSVQAPLKIKAGTVVEIPLGFSLLVNNIVECEPGEPIIFYCPNDRFGTQAFQTGFSRVVIGQNGRIFANGNRIVFKSVQVSLEQITSANDPPLSDVFFEMDSVTNAVTVDHCENITINNLSIKGTQDTQSGIYLYKCPSSVVIRNCTIDGVEVGVESEYSSAIFENDTIKNCASSGISWKYDYSSTEFGKITGSVITDNGSGATGAAGFVGYACSPILTCNTITSNADYAVKVYGNAAPSFWDAGTYQGANTLSGVSGEPIVYINGATPLFANGGNYFTLGSSSYFMYDAAPDIKHDVRVNAFDPNTNLLTHFYPSDSKYWWLDNGDIGGLCEELMLESLGGDIGSLMAGDAQAAAGQEQLAVSNYSTAVVLSGDSTGAGSAALSRLAKHNPLLPPVGAPLVTDKWYNSSYGYDAVGDFNSADAYRDTILLTGDAFDSLRIEFDLASSMTLRPSTMSSGARAEAAREQARVHRRDLFNKLTGVQTLPRPQSAPTAIPTDFAINRVYPNPFNATTTIEYTIPKTGKVDLKLYDVSGREVATLVNFHQNPGTYKMTFDGKSLSTGTYFLRLQSSNFTQTRKLLLLK